MVGAGQSCPQKRCLSSNVPANLDQTNATSHTSTLPSKDCLYLLIPQIQVYEVIDSATNKNNERHQADLQPEGRPA
jgi:hypothetical protein